jgi:hypothetical protein
MSGELALRLIRSIRTNTESTVINDLFLNNNIQSTPTNTTVTEEIDIVPYKCLCPYSTTSNNGHSNLLKRFSRFVKNIPCDRPCSVNLYRHLRNYHKVDLQYAKEITRIIMLSKTVKSEISTEDNQIEQKTIKKRIKLPVRLNLEEIL